MTKNQKLIYRAANVARQSRIAREKFETPTRKRLRKRLRKFGVLKGSRMNFEDTQTFSGMLNRLEKIEGERFLFV